MDELHQNIKEKKIFMYHPQQKIKFYFTILTDLKYYLLDTNINLIKQNLN